MRRSTLVFIITAAIILISGILFLALWPEKEEENDTPPTPRPVQEIGTLINVSHTEVDNVVMMPFERTAYTLQLDHSDDEYWDILLVSDDAIFPGMQPVMYTIFQNATNLLRLTRLSEDADDEELSRYGFDTPILEWRVNLLDGSSAGFELGLRLATGSGNYIREKDSRDIYIIDDAAVSVLIMDIKDIYDIFFLPFPPSSQDFETWDFIEYLLLERPGDDTIELRQRDEEEWFDSPLGVSRYQLLQPFVSEGSDAIIKSVLLEPVTNIIPEMIVAIRPDNPAAYGLERPARLTLSAAGWEGTLLIGDFDIVLDGRYVMIEGTDAVLLDPHGNYKFLELDPNQLRTQMNWVHHIDSVSSVVFDLDGKIRTLRIGHPAPGSSETLNGWLDDKELGERNTRRLFATSMSIPSSGSTNDPVPDRPPSYRITMNFIAGGSQTLELYSISDSQFLMAIDRKSLGAYTTRMQIQVNLLSRFETLDAGEDLQMR